MDATIARLNIERFRKKLSEEPDEAQKKTLRELLAEEEKKLAAFERGNNLAIAK
jgi:hypothetical protein